jgi:hypothetical protein
MPRLLSGSTLRRGGSGEFIDLAGAMPQLPATETTLTGFSLVTDSLLRTSYRSSLGFVEFHTASMYSALPLGTIKVLATGSTFLSTSTNTGNLVVEGGIGVGGNMHIEDDIVVNGLTIGRGYEGLNNIVIKGEAEPVGYEGNDGQETIIIGYDALTGLVTSYKNIAIGRYALNSGTRISNSIAIGDSSLKLSGFIDKILSGVISNVTITPSSSISAVSNTSPISVTSVGHGLTSGTQIYIEGVSGISIGPASVVNDQVLYAWVVDSQTIDLYYNKSLTIPVNGTTATAYVSGGLIRTPVVLTILNSSLTTGSNIFIDNVSGMTELNNQSYYVNEITTSTFGLYVDPIIENPLDGTSYSSYTGGGNVYRIMAREGNVSIGNNSSEYLIDGRDNVFIGNKAGQTLTTGSYNIIIGHNKLPFLNTGSGIISIGGDNIVDGLDDQVNIGSVFYYDGRGYSYISADTSIGLGTDSTGTSSGALMVTGGVGVSGSVYSADGNPDENQLLYTPKVTITAGTAPANPKVGDFWIDSSLPAFLQYVKDGTNTFWIQIGAV